MFGKKKKREGAVDEDTVREQIRELQVHDGATVHRINWDGSESSVSGRVTVVGDEFESFSIVEDGTGNTVDFSIDMGDIKDIQRVAISIDIDETQVEQYMPHDAIIEVLGALEHGDEISVTYYDHYKGRAISQRGTLTISDEYNKIFAIEFVEEGEKHEKEFKIDEDKIVDILIQ